MGWIGNAISAVGSAISTGISTVCSTIGSALFSGGTGIAALAKSFIAPVIGLPIVEILVAVETIGKIISVVAGLLGLTSEEETPEELGMKAEEAEKKPEDFDSTQEYIEYLRNEVKVDKQKLETLSQEEKVVYGAIGSAIYVKGMEEKYGMEMSGDFWATVAQMNMKGEEVKAYIESFKAAGIKDMKDMSDYIKCEPLADGKNPKIISDAMLGALKELNPEMSDEALEDKLLDMSV